MFGNNDGNRFLPGTNDFGSGSSPVSEAKTSVLIRLVLAVVLIVLLCWVASVSINFLAGLGASGSFEVFDWFKGAGFRSESELGNFFRLALLAVFVGWAISRFRR